ncbi:hypothetical protein BC830DRAFT_1080654 [Chytriomyces sp. MP71]|nr:hypothetical protein BC830DRAFT_1080654 [Chytriomyces sp. MP71]
MARLPPSIEIHIYPSSAACKEKDEGRNDGNDKDDPGRKDRGSSKASQGAPNFSLHCTVTRKPTQMGKMRVQSTSGMLAEREDKGGASESSDWLDFFNHTELQWKWLRRWYWTCFLVHDSGPGFHLCPLFVPSAKPTEVDQKQCGKQDAKVNNFEQNFLQAIQTGQPADIRADLQVLYEGATQTLNALINELTALIKKRDHEGQALHAREIALINDRTAIAVAVQAAQPVIANAAEIADNVMVTFLRPPLGII